MLKEISCVYELQHSNFDFKLTSDAKIQPVFTGWKGSCFWLFSPWSRGGHALIGQNLTGEFTWEICVSSGNLLRTGSDAAPLMWTHVLASENSRVSSLLAAGDVSRGRTSATQRQKFHTDDVKSVRNPVRSADWSMK